MTSTPPPTPSIPPVHPALPSSEAGAPTSGTSGSRWRWAAALILGTLLWGIGLIASEVVPQVVLGLDLGGGTYALVGILRALLGFAAVVLALRIVGSSPRDVGLVARDWQREASIGAAVALVFTVLQFALVIPLTGGASRSDVAANAAQIGDSMWGVGGFVVLAWTGAFSEELFFRGHFFTCLRRVIGAGSVALIASVLTTTVLFAAGHGYQGWSGVVDTGLYGGLTMTLLFVWRRRLTACIVAHALWNTCATVLIFLLY